MTIRLLKLRHPGLAPQSAAGSTCNPYIPLPTSPALLASLVFVKSSCHKRHTAVVRQFRHLLLRLHNSQTSPEFRARCHMFRGTDKTYGCCRVTPENVLHPTFASCSQACFTASLKWCGSCCLLHWHSQGAPMSTNGIRIIYWHSEATRGSAAITLTAAAKWRVYYHFITIPACDSEV